MQKMIIATMSLVFVMIGQTASAVFAQEQQVFERPTYVVGDTWEYVNRNGETRTFKIIEVSEAGFVSIQSDKDGEKRVAFDRDGNRIDPGWRYLPFPLHVGKKWKFEVVPTERNPSGSTLVIDARVTKLTTVKTKGGTFDALVIESCWNRKDNPSIQGCGPTFWYAPKVKHMVKRESTGAGAPGYYTDYELVSFTPAGQQITAQK